MPRTLPKPCRAAPGHARHADSENSSMGTSTRPRDLPGHSGQLGRAPKGGDRLALSRASPFGAAGLARVRLEGLGEEPAGKILSADAGGEETIAGRRVQVGFAGKGNHWCHEGGGMSLWTMLKRWHRRDADLDEEIRTHLSMIEQDRVERGESAEEAALAAHREFGNPLLIKETTRDVWGWAAVERSFQDLKYALRQMRRNPGFTSVAILT